jgi:hypothetical protein
MKFQFALLTLLTLSTAFLPFSEASAKNNDDGNKLENMNITE